jgi:tetratricopeptide (TPR) repeat protein
MTAVTLTALLCGAALLVCARPQSPGAPMPGAARVALLAVMVAVGAFCFVGLVANRAIAASEDAALAADRARAAGRASEASQRWDEAEAQARKATRWAPWSTDPWAALANAQLGRRDPARAAASFRRAIAKEPGDWSLSYGLARATRGRARRAALRQAARLNPLSPEIAGLRDQIGRR